METLQQRKYYKLFTGTNQTGGSDRIYLGYEAKTSEIVFKKGQTTYFHYPFFSTTQNISATSLGVDGALSGPIPAFADRIFKKRGNYENTTPWGPTTGRQDGTWLCSWYYASSSEPPIWLDRYYDPGHLSYEEALNGTANFDDYVKKEPIYYDVPSVLTLEPGGYFAFYHHDEESIKNIVDTFSGSDKKRLRLYIENWKNTNNQIQDESIYNNIITINSDTKDWTLNILDPGYVDRSVLSFANTDFINCYITQNSNYNLENEFTLSFWISHKDWSNATSTQLVGNLKKGGYGVFYNNLNYNPFFVVPETKYGHLFYINQNIEVYTEKNIQPLLGAATSIGYILVNLESEVIVVDTSNRQLIKYNHIGDVITTSKNNFGENIFYEGEFIQMLLHEDDSVYLYTTTKLYIYNKDLILLSIINLNTTVNTCFARDAEGQILAQTNCFDLIYDNFNNKWHISRGNKKVYKNDTIVSTVRGYNGRKLAIDPENNLWILTNQNKVLKIDILTNEIISEFEVGTNTLFENISFIQNYTRETDLFTWYALIYQSDNKTLFKVSLDGKTLKTIYLPQKFNTQDPVSVLQDVNLLEFNCSGDFTGYEHRRVSNKLLYNNIPQVQFKVSVKQADTNLPNSIYTLSAPTKYFTNNVWHLITVTNKNSVLNLYIDNLLQTSYQIPNNTVIDYDYKNDLYIGSPCGKNNNLNIEINSKNIIWNGYIDSLKIYDYAIPSYLIRYFVLEKILFSDIVWNIPTAPIQYIEGIDRIFKNRLPGHKSTFFNLKLAGAEIKDLATKNRIESDLRIAVEQIKPGHSELLNIEWIE